VLNNESLYGGYGEDWAKILLRLPLLPDAVPYFGSDPEQDEALLDDKPPDDDSFMPLYNASRLHKEARNTLSILTVEKFWW
jgi:hypothetical protein